MTNNEKIDNRKNLIDNTRSHIIKALRSNVEIIESYDLYNDFDFQYINYQIDDTIKLLELLKIRFVEKKEGKF